MKLLRRLILRGVVTGVSFGTATITYTVSTGCASPVSAAQNITVSAAASAGTVTGMSPVCINTTAQYSTTGDAGGTWSSTNQSVATVSTSGLVTSLSSGSTDITYTVTGGCNGTVSSFQTFTVSPSLPTPGAISGPVDACPLIGNATPTTYAIAAVAGATSYTWTVPVGVTLVNGQGSTSIDVTFDNSFALTNSRFRVTAGSATACSSLPSELEVLKNVPGIPTSIAGPTNVCPFTGQSTTATYSISPVTYATSYTWVTPANALIISGQGSTSIEVSFTSVFTSGSIKVTANSNCGSRAARSLSISKAIPSSPSSISGPVNACPFIGNMAPRYCIQSPRQAMLLHTCGLCLRMSIS